MAEPALMTAERAPPELTEGYVSLSNSGLKRGAEIERTARSQVRLENGLLSQKCSDLNGDAGKEPHHDIACAKKDRLHRIADARCVWMRTRLK